MTQDVDLSGIDDPAARRIIALLLNIVETLTARTQSPSPRAAAVACLSTEFGDDAPRVSQTRVENLRRAGGLDEVDLLLLLDEAATIALTGRVDHQKRPGGDDRAHALPVRHAARPHRGG